MKSARRYTARYLACSDPLCGVVEAKDYDKAAARVEFLQSVMGHAIALIDTKHYAEARDMLMVRRPVKRLRSMKNERP